MNLELVGWGAVIATLCRDRLGVFSGKKLKDSIVWKQESSIPIHLFLLKQHDSKRNENTKPLATTGKRRNFNVFGGSEECPTKIFFDLVFLVTVVDQMVLGPLTYPAKIHCTAVFALWNGKFLRLGGVGSSSPPVPTVKFRPWLLAWIEISNPLRFHAFSDALAGLPPNQGIQGILFSIRENQGKSGKL